MGLRSNASSLSLPAVWPDANLEGSRFSRWQLYKMAATESLRGRQAAPGNGPGLCSPQGHWSGDSVRMGPTNLPSAGSFAGAACCHPAELPSCKAAPLQTRERLFDGGLSHEGSPGRSETTFVIFVNFCKKTFVGTVSPPSVGCCVLA